MIAIFVGNILFMIGHNDRMVECSVVLSATEKPSVIKKVGEKIEFCERSAKGVDYKVEFLMRTVEGDKVVASTEPTENTVPIGHDFIWRFCSDPNVTCVNVAIDGSGNVKTHSGSVVVSPCDKVFSIVDLQAAFEAGRRHTYDAFYEDHWSFDFDTFKDWYINFKKDTK